MNSCRNEVNGVNEVLRYKFSAFFVNKRNSSRKSANKVGQQKQGKLKNVLIKRPDAKKWAIFSSNNFWTKACLKPTWKALNVFLIKSWMIFGGEDEWTKLQKRFTKKIWKCRNIQTIYTAKPNIKTHFGPKWTL
jgi:hypothetical protein